MEAWPPSAPARHPQQRLHRPPSFRTGLRRCRYRRERPQAAILVRASLAEGGSDVASTNRRAGDRYLERSRQERRRRERPPPLGAPPHRSPASVAAQQPGELALNANPHRRITLRPMIAIGRIEADHRAFPPEVFERSEEPTSELQALMRIS